MTEIIKTLSFAYSAVGKIPWQDSQTWPAAHYRDRLGVSSDSIDFSGLQR